VRACVCVCVARSFFGGHFLAHSSFLFPAALYEIGACRVRKMGWDERGAEVQKQHTHTHTHTHTLVESMRDAMNGSVGRNRVGDIVCSPKGNMKMQECGESQKKVCYDN